MHPKLVKKWWLIKDVLAAASITIMCTAGILIGFVAVMVMLNLIFGGDVGIYFYGSPQGINWGLGFFGTGGLELNGPDGISFFACTGQC